eukprot:1147173_1
MAARTKTSQQTVPISECESKPPEEKKEQKEPDVVPFILKRRKRNVKWTNDTVDNEHMNKKKSKSCCIYHKPRRFDESDSESGNDRSDSEGSCCSGDHSHSHKKTSDPDPKPSEPAPTCISRNMWFN